MDIYVTAESLVMPEPTAFEAETTNMKFDGYISQVLIKFGRQQRKQYVLRSIKLIWFVIRKKCLSSRSSLVIAFYKTGDKIVEAYCP
jgi:hypothetical protein